MYPRQTKKKMGKSNIYRFLSRKMELRAWRLLSFASDFFFFYISPVEKKKNERRDRMKRERGKLARCKRAVNNSRLPASDLNLGAILFFLCVVITSRGGCTCPAAWAESSSDKVSRAFRVRARRRENSSRGSCLSTRGLFRLSFLSFHSFSSSGRPILSFSCFFSFELVFCIATRAAYGE